ncbi:hypothetical protein EYF80_057095 [Liparis tanakae]|uniref:Uncharacterized protein n=1 Tax=Liparis tanakae TaxID=230148 RepID=A0A4Z2EW05_9TELE|nr:hypothetical protein EYF80_057095 [Liparis tanakae]
MFPGCVALRGHHTDTVQPSDRRRYFLKLPWSRTSPKSRAKAEPHWRRVSGPSILLHDETNTPRKSHRKKKKKKKRKKRKKKKKKHLHEHQVAAEEVLKSCSRL